MGILKFASSETKRIDLGEGDFIDVHAGMSKRDFNALMAKMPNREMTEESGLTLQEGLEFQLALFEAMVTGWSLSEPATVENYLNLDREAGEAIDSKLIEHFGALTPSADERSKARTSPRSRRREPLSRV